MKYVDIEIRGEVGYVDPFRRSVPDVSDRETPNGE